MDSDLIMPGEKIGPSGWPEEHRNDRLHAITMLRQSLRANRRALISRKRADIADRPHIASLIAALEAHITRLQASI